MRALLTIFVLILAVTSSVLGQKKINGSIVYGNEWIDYSKTYYKLTLEEDGVYKVSKSDLEAVGFPVNTPMSQYKLIHLGEEVAIQTTTNSTPNNNDYFIFYGKKNRSEVDRFVYENDDMILNTEYSIVSDQSAYFLTIENGNHKRISSKTSNVSASSNFEDYIWDEKAIINNNTHFKPTYRGQAFLKYSSMDKAEGFANKREPVYETTIKLEDYYDANIRSDIQSRSNTNHGPSYNTGSNPHFVEIDINGTKVFGKSVNDYEIIEHYNSMITGSEVKFKITNTGNSSNRISVPFVKIVYPRSLGIGGLTNFEKNLIVKAGSKRNFALSTSAKNVKVLVPSKNELISIVQLETNKIGFEIEALSTDQKIVVFDEKNIKKPTVNSGIKYTDYSKTPNLFNIITHPELNKTGSVDKYSAYRASQEGGKFSTQIIDVTQLYDQYAYGVDNHFAGIRNFSNKVKNLYSPDSYFFLMGKGVQYSQYRTKAQRAKSLKLWVPTFGDPSSDNQLFSDFDSPVPFFNVGRLAAGNSVDIDNYLRKMVENEKNINNGQTVGDRLWMKKILHMSGGGDGDYKRVAEELEEIERVIETNKVGADVTTFYKHSSDIIDGTYGEKALPTINNGLAFLTFFGHAGVVGTDFKIVDPINFDNEGKLPIVISLGCYSGNCNTSATGISEDYVITKDKGGSAFIATTSTSYASDLGVLGQKIYGNYGGKHYGGRIGNTMRSAITDALATQQGNEFSRLSMVTTLQQTILHGDPAYRLYFSDGSDYVLDYETANMTPNTIYTLTEKIDFCIDVENIGTNNINKLDVVFSLVDQDNNVLDTQTQKIDAPTLKTNVCVSFDTSERQLAGQYKIKAEVNPSRENIEGPTPAAFNNNILLDNQNQEGFSFNVLSRDIFPTYPERYAIVNSTDVKLVATTFDAFSDKADYIIQLDTTATFDSPFLKSKNLNSYSPIKADFTLLDKEDQVYYWRTRINESDYAWKSSSFVYNSTSGAGWNQQSDVQFEEDDVYQLTFNDGQLAFAPFQHSIEVELGVNRAKYFRNGSQFDKSYFNNDGGFAVVVFKDNGSSVYNFSASGRFGSIKLPGAPTDTFFEYKADSDAEQEKIINILEKLVRPGYTGLVVSMRKRKASDYGLEALKSSYENGTGILRYLESKGATKVQQLLENPQVPYIFAFTNENGAKKEEIGNSASDNITALFYTDAIYQEGSITSKLIGKSKSYNKVIWNAEASATSTAKVEVIGVNANGGTTLLKEYEQPGEYDISDINASLYPYLKLVYKTTDKKFVPAQLLQLRVLYNGYPDLILERDAADNSSSEEVKEYNQGEVITYPITVSNYSSFDAEELFDVSYTTTNDKNTKNKQSSSYDGLKKGESINVPLTINTSDQEGLYKLEIEVNSFRNTFEENYFNNKGLSQFFVIPDLIAPNLDVTFDGQYIANNDIISANPEIDIVLTDKDINTLLVSRDIIEAKIIGPDGNEIVVDETNSTFIPATSQNNNQASLKINPELLQDGTYTIEINGQDEKGNRAGSTYITTFRVINKQSVSNVYNYPNPFSTSTQFLFTLTGNELPSGMLIRIYTISGKIVREITSEELGTVKIGLNKTDYKWDGTDEYGNKLAAGTYLYKVITKDASGNDFEKLKVNKDYLFKNGFGKLVIIR